ncbi:unnamed protein product [Diatraea saccharalis]|uniref:Uncharacterized protein n=1 Tax=Diatraea saccharalis TaxID=40085 RepID=A0A9N9WEU4_9NEOP|nr:unnamed protein product [Diatraea saccharalis]
MDVKIACILFLAIVSQGYGITEIRLEDKQVSYLTNNIIGRSIGIGKSFLDRLVVCMVTFPNGIAYEAFPNDNTPSTVTFGLAAEPFRSCVIEFKDSNVAMSGIYDLASMVLHTSNSSHTITRRRFNLTISEVEF